jgi:glycosyltransferase involved in cell wall biosynthesis
MQGTILYVITKSNWGGAQKYVYDLAAAAKERGASVAVALGGTGALGAPEGRLAKDLAALEIRTHFIPSFARDVHVGADMSAYRELARIIRAERPDVVHLNSSKAGGIGALAARMQGVPRIIFTAHGWAFREARNPLSKSLIYCASWATCLLVDYVIAVSKQDYAQAPCSKQKVVLIHNGIALPIPLESGESIRSAFPAGARITGTVGELTKNKNHIALIERARREPDLHVAIVGEGETRPLLEAKIKEYGLEDRVKLFGFLTAPQALRGFDAFALPSLKEGLPYILIEARAAGLPIEANRVGGVGEILDAPDLEEFSLERMLERTFALYAPPRYSFSSPARRGAIRP